MKSPLTFKTFIWPLSAFAGLLLLQGCAVYNPNYASTVPVSDIVKESRAGVPSKDIIRELRRTHSVYTLNANELARLKEEGVQDSVINYMEQTHLNAIRQEQRMEDYYYGYPGYGWGPGWGWGLGWGFGYPFGYWGWGPTVIVHGDFDHDFHGGSSGGAHVGGRR
jgi:hypothetical protein